MPISTSYYREADLALAKEFLAEGYVVRAVEDRPALDALRAEIARIASEEAKRPTPADAAHFLDNIHAVLPTAALNEVRLATYRRMNALPWFGPTYFALGRGMIESLVGNELAIQNRINLSIQYPGDDSSLLDIHTDVYSGETPFQVVQWLPLVDCSGTKSMFILPLEKSRRIHERLAEFTDGGMAAVFAAVRHELVWLEVPYGALVIFSPNLFHGNVVNETAETRWSLNCRFTGLFTPYTSEHKKIGSFYLPITVRPVSRIGMAYRHPEGFEE